MIRLVTLGEIMRKLEVADLMTFSHAVGLAEGAFAVPDKKDKVHPELITHTARAFRTIEVHCEEFGLNASLATCRRLFDLLECDSEIEYKALALVLTELQSRVQDETDATYCLSFDPQEANWYSQPLKGWELTIQRFREATTDVEEAMKCLALERYAAAVFHSCLIVEAGLIELGSFLGVTDPKSGFTAVSKALEKVTKKPHQDRSALEKTYFDFIEQTHGLVEALKNAWRNKISHSQGRLYLLSSDFKRDTTEEIIYATRAFMRRLAEELPA